MIVLGLLLMLIVLIQRGKGGGLAGAFGGAGGSSPFGSRAADQFVKITLWLAGVWVLVIMIHVKVVKYDSVDQANKPVIGGELSRVPREPARARPRQSPMRPTGVLLSMTGFGEARTQADGLGVAVEVRAVNNRHLKVTVRGTDPYPLLEAELEKVVRRHVRRGTLTVHVRVERPARPADLNLNAAALRTYLQQIRAACEEAGTPEFAARSWPGCWPCRASPRSRATSARPPDDEWPVVEQTLDAALRRLDAMRREEGRAMADELLAHHRTVADQLDAVRGAPAACDHDYRQRLLERVRQAVGDAGVAIQPEHLIREVALFADRTDVSEEVTGSAPPDQFAELVRKGDEAGRKLEFVVQEMGRETNTLGSKAAT